MPNQYRLRPKPKVVHNNRVLPSGPKYKVRATPKASPAKSVPTIRPQKSSISLPTHSKPIISKPGKQKRVPAVRQPRINKQTRTREAVERKERMLKKYHEALKSMKNVAAGRTLVILGCGPSINEIDTSVLNSLNLDTMTINKPDKRVWPTTYWAFCDQSQYNRNKEAWEEYKGLIINSTAVRARKKNQVLIKNMSGYGFSQDLVSGYYLGRSTVFANMQTALWMNYSKVYIFGVDMCAVGGQLHYYGVNPDVPEKTRLSRFANEAEHYNRAADSMIAEHRQKFIFCSSYNEWPFTRKFKSMSHKKAIGQIKNGYGQVPRKELEISKNIRRIISKL